MQPDWDMFQSLHPMAEFHEAARAVGGCAIYVSDRPGNHGFDLLKKLALPNGSILRAKLPGKPTRNCLFSDPTRDGKSLLKIWNLNDHCGVIGAFNCQGAGWCRIGKTNVIHDQQPGTITGCIWGKDVGYLPRVAEVDWNGDVIVYLHQRGEVVYLPKDQSLPITLKSREFEVFTVVPVKILPGEYSFAPIGLLKLFNSGGAVKELKYESGKNPIINFKAHGCGVLGAYSSFKPKKITIDSEEVDFSYDSGSGLVTLVLTVPKNELYSWSVSIEL